MAERPSATATLAASKSRESSARASGAHAAGPILRDQALEEDRDDGEDDEAP